MIGVMSAGIEPKAPVLQTSYASLVQCCEFRSKEEAIPTEGTGLKLFV
jgi:hypothetical protein